MNSERTYGLILPPGYAKNSQQRYPVIFLLQGGHGDARAYQDKAAVTSVLHDLYQSKRLPPSIIITPDGNDQRGTSPLWDQQYSGSQINEVYRNPVLSSFPGQNSYLTFLRKAIFGWAQWSGGKCDRLGIGF
ncbi:alpha/beta hydrolase-fold protein [Microcoleus sp. EPA2]|uniref:alpha/beta hydrolase-fold protein n=1 Tax=Microcoleus sp. EPA2 TaxID=2841654 RepID=UPI00312B3DB4